jgi:hypothetical protein
MNVESESFGEGYAETTLKKISSLNGLDFERTLEIYSILNGHKASCLEIFHERKLEFDAGKLDNCLTKLLRADIQVTELVKKLNH